MSVQVHDGYALGRSDAETRRLILQQQIYGPLTRRFLAGAGITAGMRVLDLGSGAGDVALLLADLVGPTGRVVGVDVNAAILDTARARVDAVGWSNVEFRHGDVPGVAAGERFDAVVGRWILMYLPDPVQLIRRCLEHLRPGGIVAFQESDLRSPLRPYPAAPLHEQVVRWMTPPAAGGPETQIWPKLFRTLVEAGLAAPQLRMEAPLGGGADWPGFRYVAETMRSLLPMLERFGAASAAEVDVDTLADRLRAEAGDLDAVQILPPVIGAWARR